ncbi:hypothetical protein ACOTED_11750 [Achromobacter xylosoxidans]
MSLVFKSERHAEAVRQAYAAALAHWPADVRRVTVPTPAGDTHVLVCGREDARPWCCCMARRARPPAGSGRPRPGRRISAFTRST